MHQETKRKFVHISMVAWALLIGHVPPIFIVLLALVALMNNYFLLPRITGKALERSSEKDVGYSMGMLMYPAVILCLSLVFYRQQVVVAIAWGVMAFGDGFAGLIGAKLGGPRWPWNPKKGLLGSVAFVVFGSLGTIGLVMLLPKNALLGIPFGWYPYVIVGATLCAALMETVDGLIDDNLSVPVTAAVSGYLLLLITQWPVKPEQLNIALIFIALLTIVSIGAKKIDLIGGLAGFVIALAIFLGGGFPTLSLLFVFFFLGSFVSKWGMKEKQKLGLAQENKGKRSLRHAMANGGAAAFCGLAGWLHPEHATLFAAMAAGSLASAAADTCASELGNLYGKKFINVLTFKPGPRGEDGVVSLEGTLLGAAAALLIAAVYFAWGVSLEIALIVAVAGMIGNYVDSVLGASLQAGGFMTNDTVNAANTFTAALVVMGLSALI